MDVNSTYPEYIYAWRNAVTAIRYDPNNYQALLCYAKQSYMYVQYIDFWLVAIESIIERVDGANNSDSLDGTAPIRYEIFYWNSLVFCVNKTYWTDRILALYPSGSATVCR